jgi:hypothetical protein
MFVAFAKASGVSFDRSATLGHQELSASAGDVSRAFTSAGLSLSTSDASGLIKRSGRWVDGVLRHLGAQSVDSIDVSDYESCTILHDLNQELPADLEGRFSMLLDVGTLEHVFDFPTAIRSCMRMVEVGGHLLLVTPTNNEAGHGFYQFSPELLFRVLAPAYGYEIEDMLLLELGRRGASWFRVTDPQTVESRAQFVSRAVTYLFVLARRVGPVPTFDPAPQQSDYVSAWREGWWKPTQNASRPAESSILAFVRRIRRQLPAPVDRGYRWFRRRMSRARHTQSLFGRVDYSQLTSHFTPIDLPRMTRPTPDGPDAVNQTGETSAGR